VVNLARRGQRKFTTFEWREEGASVEIPVWVRDQSSGTDFRAVHEGYGIDLHDTDIGKLRTAVFAAMRQRYHIEWQRFIWIKVKAAFGFGMPDFEAKGYLIGKRPDGVVVNLATDLDSIFAEDWRERGNGRTTEGMPDTGKAKYEYGPSPSWSVLLPVVDKETSEAMGRWQKAVEDFGKEMVGIFHDPRSVQKLLDAFRDGKASFALVGA